MAKAEGKMGVAANSEELKLIEDKELKTKLTPPVDMVVNTVRPLCSLILSVLCRIVVQNPKKPLDIYH